MAVHELVDIAQILQQFPGFAERRRDQLDQRFGEIGGDVFIGQRRAQRLGMPRLNDVPRGRDAQRLFFNALAAAAQDAPFAGIDEPGEAALEFPINHVTQYLDPRLSTYGSSATTSISTRNPGSTSRWT